jgi:hypothetical protein
MVDVVNFADFLGLREYVSHVRQYLRVSEGVLLLDVLFEVGDGSAQTGKHAQHSSYTNSITFNRFISKMEAQLEIVNRFVGIIGSGENANDRLQT